MTRRRSGALRVLLRISLAAILSGSAPPSHAAAPSESGCEPRSERLSQPGDVSQEAVLVAYRARLSDAFEDADESPSPGLAPRADSADVERALLAEALRLARGFDEEAKSEPKNVHAGRLHLARSLALASHHAADARPFRLEAARLFAVVAAESRDARERIWADGERAALYLDADRPGDAIRLARRALSGAEIQEDLLAQVRFGRTLAFALDEQGERAAALRLLRRTAALGESLRRDRIGRVDPAADIDRLARARSDGEELVHTTDRLIAMLLDAVENTARAENPAARNGPDSETTPSRQAALREVRDLVETSRSAEIEDYFQDACLRREEDPSERAALRQAIEGTLIVYPLILEDRVGLLVESGGVFSYFRSTLTPDRLRREARQFRRLLEKRTTRQYLRPASALFEGLIRPLMPMLEADSARALVVVADDLLRTIPFAALHDEKADRDLIDLIPVAHVPSMRFTRPGPPDREEMNVLAAGLSESRGGFQALDYTRTEIRQLAARFPSRVLFDEAFRIDALETEIRTRPYSIVHLATHGRLESAGAESFLQTHDGRLGLERMTGMIQTTRFRKERPLELLTLSACETAAGDDRAALGLAGVAVRTGARSALATLWPVNDEAAALLVDRFYEEWMKPEQTRAGALRVAQLEVRAMLRFSHPGYWAPFLMISNWL